MAPRRWTNPFPGVGEIVFDRPPPVATRLSAPSQTRCDALAVSSRNRGYQVSGADARDPVPTATSSMLRAGSGFTSVSLSRSKHPPLQTIVIRKASQLVFFDYSGPVRPDTPGTVDTVGASDGPVRRRGWTLSNDSSPIGSGTSGAVSAVRAGDGMSGHWRCEHNDGQTKRCYKQRQNAFHFGEALFRLAGRSDQVAI